MMKAPNVPLKCVSTKLTEEFLFKTEMRHFNVNEICKAKLFYKIKLGKSINVEIFCGFNTNWKNPFRKKYEQSVYIKKDCWFCLKKHEFHLK